MIVLFSLDERLTIDSGEIMNDKIGIDEAADVLNILPENLMKLVVKHKVDFVSDGDVVLFEKVDIVTLKQIRRKEQSDSFNELRKLDEEFEIFE